MTAPSFADNLLELRRALASGDVATVRPLSAALADTGQLDILDLVSAAQMLSDYAQYDAAIGLYRGWLRSTQSPLAYAAWYNLAVLLSETGDPGGAEAAYRAAVEQNPQFSEAWFNLGKLLENEQRPVDALASWHRLLTETRPSFAVKNSTYKQAIENVRRLRTTVPAHGAEQGKPGLVSVLIPTHNRPDYVEQAVQSVLAQNWDHFEIIISDNSDDELTRERLAPYVASNPCITYSRVPGYTATENGRNCFSLARGEFINFLMDDDLFHPEKLSRMMSIMAAQPDVGLVTSFRQLIDADGNFIDQLPGTERLFEADTLIEGKSLGDQMLADGRNLLGEPTTVLFRKSVIEERFGDFLGAEYVVLSDVATWLAALSRSNCVYLPEALSYFRIHGGQDQQRGNVIRVRANVEWLLLLCSSIEQQVFMATNPAIRDMLTNKLVTMIWFMSSMHEEIAAGAVEVEKIHDAVNRAMKILVK